MLQPAVRQVAKGNRASWAGRISRWRWHLVREYNALWGEISRWSGSNQTAGQDKKKTKGGGRDLIRVQNNKHIQLMPRAGGASTEGLLGSRSISYRKTCMYNDVSLSFFYVPMRYDMIRVLRATPTDWSSLFPFPLFLNIGDWCWKNLLQQIDFLSSFLFYFFSISNNFSPISNRKGRHRISLSI